MLGVWNFRDQGILKSPQGIILCDECPCPPKPTPPPGISTPCCITRKISNTLYTTITAPGCGLNGQVVPIHHTTDPTVVTATWPVTCKVCTNLGGVTSVLDWWLGSISGISCGSATGVCVALACRKTSPTTYSWELFWGPVQMGVGCCAFTGDPDSTIFTQQCEPFFHIHWQFQTGPGGVCSCCDNTLIKLDILE